ncbi:DUF6894 family protein [Ensifer soli]|uniref:DUF6894 family protein n=1 Tax=Ciceribacter sp. sgz301302 TaxID=3342379 RepID=UPI0035BB6B3C
MPTFYFDVHDQDGVVSIEQPFDFADVGDAIAEAKTVLTEIAHDGPPGSDRPLEVHVRDEAHVTRVVVRLRFDLCFCNHDGTMPS